MRIVSGQYRGRNLLSPEGQHTRPTADRVREALFDILRSAAMAGTGPQLEGLRALDAFAGSGALGFEAFSHGAAHVTFMDNDPGALGVIAANARKLGVERQTLLMRNDATKPPKAREACGLVLLDPPYRSGLAQAALVELRAKGWIAPDAVIVVELSAAEPFASPVPALEIADERRYGAARLVFLRDAADGRATPTS